MFVVLPREKLFLLKKQNEFLGFSSNSYIKVNYSRGFVIEFLGKGCFTYYVSIFLEVFDPPSPPLSALVRFWKPPLSADVRYRCTPPLS